MFILEKQKEGKHFLWMNLQRNKILQLLEELVITIHEHGTTQHHISIKISQQIKTIKVKT